MQSSEHILTALDNFYNFLSSVKKYSVGSGVILLDNICLCHARIT